MRLINPVIRSSGGSGGGSTSGAIPYTGKRANASVTQAGFAADSVTGGAEFTIATVKRTLGTDLVLWFECQLVSFTANVGASNIGVPFSLALYRDSASLYSKGTILPIIGINNASPQVIRYGGRVGSWLYRDDDDVTGDAVYGFSYNVAPDTGCAYEVYWQEIRR